MRILVTGGAGFIGSHIVDACLSRGHIVDVLDDFSTGRRENLPAEIGALRILRGDVRAAAIGDGKYDAICHQAAQPSLLTSVERPEFDAEINILGTLSVIRAAKKVGARVVMASTSAVYDPFTTHVYHEDSPLAPSRPYGIAKMAAEFYLRCSGLPYAILRYGNVYGPRQIPIGENQLVPHALNYIFNDARVPFQVNGDGEQTRDFIYVGDVARANVEALEFIGGGEVFNIGAGRGHSVNDVLAHLSAITRFAGEFIHGPPKPDEPRHVVLNSNRAARLLGWRAETLLADGLKNTVEWYKTNGA